MAFDRFPHCWPHEHSDSCRSVVSGTPATTSDSSPRARWLAGSSAWAFQGQSPQSVDRQIFRVDTYIHIHTYIYMYMTCLCALYIATYQCTLPTYIPRHLPADADSMRSGSGTRTNKACSLTCTVPSVKAV